MISFLSKRLAKTLTINMNYEETDVLWLGYTFEVIISSLINITIMAVGGLVMHKVLYVALYLLLLIPFRKYAGGYHANTHFMCILLTTGLFYSALLFAKFIYCVPAYTVIIEYIIGAFMVLKICPVSSPNKIVDEKDKPKYKKIAFIILTLESLLCLIFSYYRTDYSSFGFIIILVILLASLAGYLKPLSDGEN